MVAPPFFRFCYLFGFLTKGVRISDVLLYFDMRMRSEVDDKCCSTYSYNLNTILFFTGDLFTW